MSGEPAPEATGSLVQSSMRVGGAASTALLGGLERASSAWACTSPGGIANVTSVEIMRTMRKAALAAIQDCVDRHNRNCCTWVTPSWRGDLHERMTGLVRVNKIPVTIRTSGADGTECRRRGVEFITFRWVHSRTVESAFKISSAGTSS